MEDSKESNNISMFDKKTGIKKLNDLIETIESYIQVNKNKNKSLSLEIKNAKNENKKNIIRAEIVLNQRKMSFEKHKKYLEKRVEGNDLEITKICYTGGPCAGKTTSITKVADQLREKGYTVFIVPEAASMIFSAGGNLDMSKYNDIQAVTFQYFLMMLQISMEDIYTGLATINSNQNVVILCDRGIMDGKAYMTDAQWNLLEEEFGLRTEKMRDDRYDLVLHLVTAAKGIPEKYDLKSNPARFESYEFAKILDENLQNAWAKHPNYMTVDNKVGSDFSDKLTTVSQLIFKELGNPQNLKFYKKFLLARSETSIIKTIIKELNVKVFKFLLEDVIFFKEKNQLVYYRKREQENGIATFIKCHKLIKNGKYFESRRQTSYREFVSMRNLKSKEAVHAKKIRYLFKLSKY